MALERYINMSDEQIKIFHNVLLDNEISYSFLDSATDMINGIYYTVGSSSFSNFDDFLKQLKENMISEIYLFKVQMLLSETNGEVTYRIRYAPSRELISNNVIDIIKSAFSNIKTNDKKLGISPKLIKEQLLDDKLLNEDTIERIIKILVLLNKDIVCKNKDIVCKNNYE